MTDDPLIAELRAQISELDRAVLATLNRRLKVVAQLKRHKQERALNFVDPERERRMLEDLRAANTGPLSDEGVAQLLAALLDLTKREV
jgi:chorismate mutase